MIGKANFGLEAVRKMPAISPETRRTLSSDERRRTIPAYWIGGYCRVAQRVESHRAAKLTQVNPQLFARAEQTCLYRAQRTVGHGSDFPNGMTPVVGEH